LITAARKRSASATLFSGQPCSAMPGTRVRSVTLPSASTRWRKPIVWFRVKRPPSTASVRVSQSPPVTAPCSTVTPLQYWRSGLTTSAGLSAAPATSASMG
jgi:hypothetical protein